jgi:hypothetical protein
MRGENTEDAKLFARHSIVSEGAACITNVTAIANIATR